MLDPALFTIPRFGLASLTITVAFAVMFGMFFGLAQFLQFVMGYSPLGAALRVAPFAVAMVAIAPRGPGLVKRFGAGRVMGSGLLLASAGCMAMSLLTADTSYPNVVAGIILLSSGMALTFPTATTAIIGSLPLDKAGVASAVNDTTREVGAAVGIALLGSLLSAGYRRDLGGSLDALPLPPGALEAVQDSVGVALHVAGVRTKAVNITPGGCCHWHAVISIHPLSGRRQERHHGHAFGGRYETCDGGR